MNNGNFQPEKWLLYPKINVNFGPTKNGSFGLITVTLSFLREVILVKWAYIDRYVLWSYNGDICNTYNTRYTKTYILPTSVCNGNLMSKILNQNVETLRAKSVWLPRDNLIY